MTEIPEESIFHPDNIPAISLIVQLRTYEYLQLIAELLAETPKQIAKVEALAAHHDSGKLLNTEPPFLA